MTLLPALVLAAAAVDGQAALRHASALAALGPHPWGSPRGRFAAEYVATQFRDAGLEEVRLQEFVEDGVRGFNVVGVLRAAGPDRVVVGAHHDTVPGSPGAYDDGGGVGVVIETARVLARAVARPRTLVFASWDGEEAFSAGPSTTTGSRAFVKALGPEARNLVGAIAVEMSGWSGGAPAMHPIAYPDPVRGTPVIAPRWLAAAVESGASGAGAPLAVGDPLISWLYQPAVRAFRVRLYGDDLAFLQAGVPAIMLSDSSFTRFYPWYHTADDTADKLDPAALARMGQSVLGAVEGLSRTPRGEFPEPAWFAAFGWFASGTLLLGAGAVSLAPGLLRAVGSGGAFFAARLIQAPLFLVLLWRHPVPALWVFLLPNLVTVLRRGWLPWTIALIPIASLAALGAVAASRGMVGGTWLAPWEMAVAIAALALLVPAPGGPRRAVRKTRRRPR